MSADYVQMQFQMALARASYWHAVVVSGGYKASKTQVADGSFVDGSFRWRDTTDDERLKEALSTMNSHLRFAQECLDAVGTEKADR